MVRAIWMLCLGLFVPVSALAKGKELKDVRLSGGYKIERFVTGLNFPTGLAFAPGGDIYVSEAGGIADTEPRIVKVSAGGQMSVIATGFNDPVTDVTWHEGWLYVSHKGIITRILPDGSSRQDLITGLPSQGDHSNAEISFGPDGRMYFSIGSATNSGVVGLDNFAFGWVPQNPGVHDIPCQSIALNAVNYTTANPLTSDPSDVAVTGAFQPFGDAATQGEVVPGEVKCNGAILRANADGSALEVYAWGFRNPFGLNFDAAGQLWTINNGIDERGSRPIEEDLDAMFRVEQGQWYGWPDYSLGRAVNEEEFAVVGIVPDLVLAEHPDLSPNAAGVGSQAGGFAAFEDHVSANKFDFSTSGDFKFVGDAFVAETGSFPPVTGAADFFGYRVTRVDMETGAVSVFLANRSGDPAFVSGEDGINKPIDVKFDPEHPEFMYVLDFGVFLPGPGTEEVDPMVETGTGVIYRIARSKVANKADREEDLIGSVQGNPMARETRISYTLSTPSSVKIQIYDISGRLVNTLVDRAEPAGDHLVVWNRADVQGERVRSGVYFLRVSAATRVEQRKLVVLDR